MESTKPTALLGVSAIFFCLVTVTSYYKENGLKDVGKLKQAIISVKKEKSDIRLENERIRQELSSLNNSNAYVESIAREQLGLVKPNEVVYEFIDAERLKDTSRM